MEDNKENQGKESEKKTKQQITIPFVWEEKPGAPKKEWKPKKDPPPPVPLPVKYVTSVPFKWEEKPGTPLRCFSQESKDLAIQETIPENKCLPLPPAFFNKYESDSDEESYYDEDSDWMSDFGGLSIKTEESFSSAFSLPKESVATAVRLQNPFVTEQDDGLTESPSSPEGITVNPSLKGTLFLQHLFPLYSPKSRFLEKHGNADQSVGKPDRAPPTLLENRKLLGGEGGRSGVIRRPLTLGELIMMSRRRSYRKRAIHMKKQNPPKDLTKNEPQGCFNFGASGGGMTKLLGKDLLSVKFA